ncbi:MAG: V-type ATP synthase subunit F [Candidatus Hadarchaeum sp.]|uniref:V-type ATP synthase subunit F n=1 Tax=Candidatus Hadarchaeum sp. TaxID=2883567 RepID=UPI003D0BB60D
MGFKIAVIGDLETITGFNLAGVQFAHVHTDKEKTLSRLEEFLSNEEIGLILITHRVAEEISPEFRRKIQEKGLLPLVLKIPDRSGYVPESDELQELVRKTVGVEIKLKTEAQ